MAFLKLLMVTILLFIVHYIITIYRKRAHTCYLPEEVHERDALSATSDALSEKESGREKKRTEKNKRGDRT
jgi:hypothetical protein